MLTSPPHSLAHPEVTAYWNRTCADGRRRSHWREAMPEEWLRIWVTHGDMLREQWPEVVGLPGATWVEWGCGGGANVMMLAEIARMVYGVDVSAESLYVCSRVVAETGRSFGPVPIHVDFPEHALNRVPLVDGFLSTSTFQHFPSKEYTERIVRLIPRLVRPGGYVFVQIRRDSPENHRPDAELPYEQRAMYATVYDVDEFGGLLAAHGVDVEKVEDVDRGQYSYFFGRVRHLAGEGKSAWQRVTLSGGPEDGRIALVKADAQRLKFSVERVFDPFEPAPISFSRQRWFAAYRRMAPNLFEFDGWF